MIDPDPYNKLRINARQQKFVAEYLLDPDAVGAYHRAGYEAKNPAAAAAAASRLLKNVNISEAIRAGQQQKSKETGITAAVIVKKLLVLADNDDPAVQLKALELLGKHIGMWPKEVKLKGDAENPLVKFTDKELLDGILGLAAAEAATATPAGTDPASPGPGSS